MATLSPPNRSPMSIVHAQSLMKRSKQPLPHQQAKSQVVASSPGHGIARSLKLHLHQLPRNSRETRSTSVPFVTPVTLTLHPVLTTPLPSIFPLPALDPGGIVSPLIPPSAYPSQLSGRCKLGEAKRAPPLPSPPPDQAHKSMAIFVQVHPVSSHLRLRSPIHITSLEVEVRPPTWFTVPLLSDHRPPVPSLIRIPTPITVPCPCLSNGGASRRSATLLYRIVSPPAVLPRPRVHN